MKKTNWMIAIFAIIIIAAMVIVVVLKKDKETRTLYCGPGENNPVTVFINPTKAFPAFAEDYSVKLNSGVTLLDTLRNQGNATATISTEINTHIVELRDKLNQDNIRTENLLKANFYAFNNTPCDTFIRKKYYSFLDSLSYKINEIEKLRAMVTVQSQKGGVVQKEREIVKDTAVLKESLNHFSENYFPQ
ncbi:MAG: hypothetical protein QM764_22300 [Chitinophagaceae bacterium]